MRPAVLGACVLFAVLAGCSRSTGPAWGNGMRGDEVMDVVPHRGLTLGEKALLWPIFREGIDYDAVQIIHAAHPFQPSDAYMAPRGHIYAPGHLFREDWSAPHVSATSRAELVHEMTHVWQFANGTNVLVAGVEQMIRSRGDYERTYRYVLDAKRDLTDYNIEQQAAILEDYYRIYYAGLQ
ncbi:MAG TPA: hypothetical protein VK427_15070, partial [Kofleriaceae bacterium]|nr:hypothetical protein [Kofleriaceae bacterium]